MTIRRPAVSDLSNSSWTLFIRLFEGHRSMLLIFANESCRDSLAGLKRTQFSIASFVFYPARSFVGRFTRSPRAKTRGFIPSPGDQRLEGIFVRALGIDRRAVAGGATTSELCFAAVRPSIRPMYRLTCANTPCTHILCPHHVRRVRSRFCLGPLAGESIWREVELEILGERKFGSLGA